MKKILIGLLALASLPAQAADYVVIHMERNVDRPAALVWSRVGGYCQIEAWFGTKCVYSAGNGEIGTNRRLNGTIDELMVGKTPLSYAYTQPASPILYHAGHSRIVYDLLYDAAPLATPQAKAEDIAKRKTRFEAGIDKMKQIAEAP